MKLKPGDIVINTWLLECDPLYVYKSTPKSYHLANLKGDTVEIPKTCEKYIKIDELKFPGGEK